MDAKFQPFGGKNRINAPKNPVFGTTARAAFSSHPFTIANALRRAKSRGAGSMPNKALSKKLKPSQKLADVLGNTRPITRAEAVKELWDYFKKNDLQNPSNRREILADNKLQPLFGKKKITMFEVGRIVNDNLADEKKSA
jgi:chromatin remodeling complex protein RSC6